jgi:itaconate CoA-transferase
MDAMPAVGQHTEAILRELGRDAEAIAALRDSGAV